MAVITTSATLQTAVGDYLARTDLTTFIPNFIQNAEDKIFRTIHLRAEETALSVSVSSGVGAVPTGFKKLKLAYVDETPIQLLQWVRLDDLYRKYPNRSGSDTPIYIAREGRNFIFGPAAKDFTLTGIYWKKSKASRDALATDATGDPDGSTAVIPGMTDTSDFDVGDAVTVSAGFPSTTDDYKILAKTSTSLTLDTNSTSAQTNVTVTVVANWYITDAPEVLLYGALLESAPFIGDDPRLSMWADLYRGALDTVKEEEKEYNSPDSSLVTRAA